MADQCFPMASLDVTWARRVWDDTLSCKKEKAKRRRSDVSHAWCAALAGLGLCNCVIERPPRETGHTHRLCDVSVAGDAFEFRRKETEDNI